MKCKAGKKSKTGEKTSISKKLRFEAKRSLSKEPSGEPPRVRNRPKRPEESLEEYGARNIDGWRKSCRKIDSQTVSAFPFTTRQTPPLTVPSQCSYRWGTAQGNFFYHRDKLLSPATFLPLGMATEGETYTAHKFIALFLKIVMLRNYCDFFVVF